MQTTPLDSTASAVSRALNDTVLDPATVEGALLYAALAFGTAAVLAWLIGTARRRTVTRQRQLDLDTAALSFVARLAQVVVFVVAFAIWAHLIPELRTLGTALLAGVSVASVVIGLAAQQTLGNLVAGLSLIVYRPFRGGEWIEITTPNGVESGYVEDLTLGYTILHTLDKRRIVVPNTLFTSQVTVNQSMHEAEVTVNVTLPVVHTADTVRACAILREIAEAEPLVIEAVDTRVTEVSVDGTVLLCRVRCQGTVEKREVTFSVLERARARFAEEGIELAYRYRNRPLKHDGESAGLGEVVGDTEDDPEAGRLGESEPMQRLGA